MLKKSTHKLDLSIFRQRYSLPMEAKILWTQSRVRDFYTRFGGDVFISFSGGKDSQVLAELVRAMGKPYSDIELVFFDTRNEDPTVYEVVSRYGATIVKSEFTPKQVIEKCGYPLFNKGVAKIIDGCQRNLPYINDPNAVRREQIEQVKERYADFINSPLRISEKCCDLLKKKPSKQFIKESGKHPIVATLAVESRDRFSAYLRTGCNSFEGSNIKSRPMSIWSTQNILDFIAREELKIADCYEAIITKGLLPGINKCRLLGKQQTGCLFCGFGKGDDFAYKILKSKHPEYCKTLKRR